MTQTSQDQPTARLGHVGVTGTRHGTTPTQRRTAHATLRDLRDRWGAHTLHHGDCLGVDAELAAIARELSYWIVAHPPTATVWRAHFPADEELPAKPYLDRDRDIVNACDVLLGCPGENTPRPHSGTWYTINYARIVKRRRLILSPDGHHIDMHGFSGNGAAS